MSGRSASGERPDAPRSRDDDGKPGDDARDAGHPRCDLCGAPMLDRHCKLVCTRCGYQRDCSDP